MADPIGLMKSDGIVPVFHDDDVDTAFAAAQAVYTGGLRTFEFTNRSDRALEVLGALIERGSDGLPGLAIGVGSIVDADAASRALDVGAAFVVGPSVNASVGDVCAAASVPYVPGASTLTELLTGEAVGCGLVKLFPASHLGGPGFLSAVRAPCPWLQVMPTGGIEPTTDSMGPWFEAGAECIGLGSSLFAKDIVSEQRWDELADRIANTASMVEALR